MKTYKIMRHGYIIGSSIPGRYGGWNGGRKDRLVFGRLDCKSGMRMKKENRVFFLTWEDALAQGFRPCKNCKPTPSDRYQQVDGYMLRVLENAERELPRLLRDKSEWRSLFIDYHPPFVERLWRDWNGFRINLHRIHACDDEALFHPHPWPSAMRTLSGVYEMEVGHGTGNDVPPASSRITLPAGATYEMMHPDAWHYVRPLGEIAMSIMVTGKPWSRPSPGSDRSLSALGDKRAQAIIKFFQKRYPLHK